MKSESIDSHRSPCDATLGTGGASRLVNTSPLTCLRAYNSIVLALLVLEGLEAVRGRGVH